MDEYHIRESEWVEVKNDVKDILTNHLPHIQVDIVRLATQMKIFGGLILTALSALIAISLS